MEESGTEPPIEDPLGIGAAGGPAWEEPTSHSVLHDLVPPGLSERNLPAALITAGVLIVAAIVSLWISKAAFAVVASIIVLIAQAELYATMHRRGYQPATALGLVVGAMLLAGAYLRGEQAMLMFVALGAVLSFLWYMAAAPKAREGALRNIGLTLLGIVYVPFLAGYALILLSQPSMGTGARAVGPRRDVPLRHRGVRGRLVLREASAGADDQPEEVVGGAVGRDGRDAVRRQRRCCQTSRRSSRLCRRRSVSR